MLRATTFILLLVAAAALVSADGKVDHVAKRATNSVRDAIKTLSERNCGGTPMGCKRDTEQQLRTLSINKDMFDPMRRAFEKKALKDKKEVAYHQRRDVKDVHDVRSVFKRAQESVAKVHEVRAKDALKTFKRDLQKSASLQKTMRDVSQSLKDHSKRYAELPWKRALDAFGPMKRTLQKKAAMEKINRAKKHLRDLDNVAKVNGLLKRAQESLKEKRDEEKRETGMFDSLKRALQMKASQNDAKREVAKRATEVKDIMKRAQVNIEKARQVGVMKRMLDGFFAPAKRELQKQAIRSKMSKATRELKTNQMKDSVKRAVEKLTTKRDEVVGKRMHDVMAPMQKMRRELHKRVAVAKLQNAAESLKRAVRDAAK